jgi:hypothetical protein
VEQFDADEVPASELLPETELTTGRMAEIRTLLAREL